jgi:hypothetical protein
VLEHALSKEVVAPPPIVPEPKTKTPQVGPDAPRAIH